MWALLLVVERQKKAGVFLSPVLWEGEDFSCFEGLLLFCCHGWTVKSLRGTTKGPLKEIP
jgi:hypothetical protein